MDNLSFRLRLCHEVWAGHGDAFQGVVLDAEESKGRDGRGESLQLLVRIRDGLLHHFSNVVYNEKIW